MSGLPNSPCLSMHGSSRGHRTATQHLRRQQLLRRAECPVTGLVLSRQKVTWLFSGVCQVSTPAGIIFARSLDSRRL